VAPAQQVEVKVTTRARDCSPDLTGPGITVVSTDIYGLGSTLLDVLAQPSNTDRRELKKEHETSPKTGQPSSLLSGLSQL